MPLGDGADSKLLLGRMLALPRCPHCATASPTIELRHTFNAVAGNIGFMPPGATILVWRVYTCGSCAGLIAAASTAGSVADAGLQDLLNTKAVWLVPNPPTLNAGLPASVQYYLQQAHDTLGAPAACIIMAASAINAMLKEKKLEDGTLHARIEQAADEGIITREMAALAHDIRLDANNERHADAAVPRATNADAQRCLEFADALAEMLFVLPARVKRGAAPAPTAR